jgi:all-trans-retinol 13,14-reductase
MAVAAETSWDAIVVGAGLGGLSAAAGLARAGLRVAVLEQHVVAGGYAHRFLRKARRSGRVYDFDVALHMTGDLRPDRWLGRQLDALGVLPRLTLRHFELAYRTRGPAHDLDVPADVNAYEARLCQTFPAEARGIRDLVAALRAADLGATGFTDLAPGARALMGKPLAEVIRAHVRDERLFAVFATLWPYLGTPPSRLDAMTFAQMWCSYHLGGCCYVAGGGQALADAFVAVIRDHGGLVRLGCAVERIVTEAGRVVGVDTARHGAFAAPIVISNAAGTTTFDRLLDQPALATRDRWTMSDMPLSASAHEVYVGLEGDAAALGLPDRLLFHVRDYDAEHDWAACERGELRAQSYVLANHNLSDPGRAPAGCSILNAIVLANGRLWRGAAGDDDPDYRRRKQEIEAFLIDLVAREIPDARARIEVCETGTPYTMTRYSWNPDGAIYGVAATPASHSYRRPPPRTQVPGLYLAGAWTFPSGGFVGAMISGLNTAALIRADVGSAIGR